MPKIAISDDFLLAYSRVPRAQQRKVREFVTRFRVDPTQRSINYEPIHDTLDDRVRTVRIGLDYRAIVLHPDEGDVYLLAWVDHHDEAMDWAKRKRFEVNPVTGALPVIDGLEAVLREQQERGGVTATAKDAIDRALDAVGEALSERRPPPSEERRKLPPGDA